MPVPLPRPPSRTEPILVWAARAHDYLRSLTPFSSPTVRVNHQYNGVSFTGSAPAAAAVTAATYAPWQPYMSLWRGTEADPYAVDRKLRFKLRRGKLCLRTPANMVMEFRAFGDAADAEIEEDDAVITQVYCSIPVTETELGSGDLAWGRPTIEIIEGDDLLEALGSVPEGGDDGSLPASIIIPICEVSWWGGALQFPPGESTYLDLALTVSGTQCHNATRAFSVIR